MSQPKWKLVGTFGDCDPITHDGTFVYEDETGVYPPEAERLSRFYDRMEWEAHRFILEPCTFINGVLSDNKFHPDHPVWFADSIDQIADYIDRDKDELIQELCGDDACKRAVIWLAVGQYYGMANLDETPLRFTDESKVRARYNL